MDVEIVGVQGTGKHALAKTIVELSSSKRVQCRTARKLPLPEDPNRLRVDFIVFIIDTAGHHSYREVEDCLQHVDKRYFLGRVCFLATRGPTQTQCIEVESLTQLADAHVSPLLWMDPTNEPDQISVAKKLIEMADIASGKKSLITPLLVDSTRQEYETHVLE